jgi:small subunit ribosomal protein S17
MTNENTEKKLKLFEGVVVSTKMDKVAVVKVANKIPHPLYLKSIWRTKKYFVRDEENKCKEGDKVQFHTCRPYSKKTKFMLFKILEA